MSVSSPSSLNATLAPPPLSSSNSSIYSSFYSQCQDVIVSKVIYSIYTFINVLLFPLYILILYMGFQQWRRQRSAPARTAMSHSDIFTYHMVLVEIFGVLGSVFYSLGIYIHSHSEHLVRLVQLGIYLFGIIYPGQTLFHCLTCVERYLAVVHPIIYMRLREARGVRIRNISIACAWLDCLGWMGLTKLYMPDFPTAPFISLLAISTIVTLFCSFSALHVLCHPGPGEVGRNKERVDQSKLRAFHMMAAIAGVLLLRSVGLLFAFSLGECMLIDSGLLLTIPSSLVLPLLFLHRTGKLACCKHSTE